MIKKILLPLRKLLLDNISAVPPLVLSLRKLRRNYRGACIRVRRSSDNTEQDIPFDRTGNLDTATLLSFVGSGSGFVTIWYDQSGNANNAIQTTAANQPRIVNSGVLDTENGRPTLIFSGSQSFVTPSTFSHSGSFSVFTVAKSSSDIRAIFQIGTINQAGSLLISTLWRIRAVGSGADATVSFTSNEVVQISALVTNLSLNIWKNGTLGTPNTTASTVSISNASVRVGALDAASYLLIGSISELVLYNSLLTTSQKTVIENNQRTTFNV